MKAPLRFVWSLLLLAPLGGTAWGVVIGPGENLFSSAPFDDVAAWVRFDPQPEPPGISFDLGDPGLVLTSYSAQFGARELELQIFTDLSGQPLPALAYTALFQFDRDLVTGANPGNVWLAPPRSPIGIAFDIDLFFPAGAAQPPGVDFTLYYGSRANGREVPFQSAPVPEPGTLLLLGSGLAGLAGWARRGRRT